MHKPLSVKPMKGSFWSTSYISPQKWAQTHTHQFKTIEKQHHTHNRWLTQSLWPGQVKSRLWWCHKEEEQGRLEKGRKDDTHTHTRSPTQCHHFLKNLTHTADKRRCSLDSVALVCWAILLAMPRTFSWLCVRFVRTEVYSGTLLRFSPSAVSAQTDAGLAVKILPGRLIFGALMQLCSWKHEHKTIDSTAFSFAKMPSFVTLFTVTWQLVHTEPFFKSS